MGGSLLNCRRYAGEEIISSQQLPFVYQGQNKRRTGRSFDLDFIFYQDFLKLYLKARLCSLSQDLKISPLVSFNSGIME
jgi:hypothetical protein